MLRIRLTRRGAKKDPHYRVVVTERSNPRDGRFTEIIGYYNPALEPVRLKLDLDRVNYWMSKGAQPTETVRTLIRRVREQVENEESRDPGEETEELEEKPAKPVEQEA